MLPPPCSAGACRTSDRWGRLERRRSAEAGRTALHNAAQQGHVETCGILLNGGADVTLKNAAGKTALDLAKMKDNEKQREVVKLLDQG